MYLVSFGESGNNECDEEEEDDDDDSYWDEVFEVDVFDVDRGDAAGTSSRGVGLMYSQPSREKDYLLWI